MSPSNPARTPRSARRMAKFGALTLAALTLSGCYRPPTATSYDDDLAKQHFVEACTTEVKVGNETTTTIALAEKSDCECVFDALKSGNNVTWEDLEEYEKEVAKTDDKDKMPTPPKGLTQAIEKCTTTGPVADDATDETTTTEAK